MPTLRRDLLAYWKSVYVCMCVDMKICNCFQWMENNWQPPSTGEAVWLWIRSDHRWEIFQALCGGHSSVSRPRGPEEQRVQPLLGHVVGGSHHLRQVGWFFQHHLQGFLPKFVIALKTRLHRNQNIHGMLYIMWVYIRNYNINSALQSQRDVPIQWRWRYQWSDPERCLHVPSSSMEESFQGR